MNILYLISYAGKAGTEKYVEDLMRLYTARGHVCHLAYWQGGALSEKAAAAGWPTLRLDMRPRNVLSAARKLADYCRKHGIDVIHAQYPRENVIAVLSRSFRRETRVVFTSHLTVGQGPAWRAVNRLVMPRNAAVVAVCTRGAELLRANGAPADRIRVVFNGVESALLPPRQNVIRREFGLGEDCFVFVTFARYAPEKGLPFLLDALVLLRKKTDRPFACLIAGDGEDYEAVGERIRALGLSDRVIRAGYRIDGRALLCSADAYVSSALYAEAMSFSILEAMSCGLPLAVTDVGAGAELASGCGLVCPPGDVEAMAENLYRLCAGEVDGSALGLEAYRRVTAEYDLAHQADKLLAIYEDKE